MLRSVMEHHLMRRITQERSPTGHGCQNARLAFDAQIVIDPAELSHPAHQGFGLMGVQIVADDMPAGGLWIGCDHRLDVGQKIGFGPSGATDWCQDLAGDDIPADNEGAGAMSDVFELPSLDFADSQRQSWVLALQSLYACQFVGTHHLLPLWRQSRCGLIQSTDGSHGLLLTRVGWRSQPIADQVRLETPFLSRREAWRGEICSIIPRRITSSAISRPVQWLIGRSLGCSQARAIIWHLCAAVICAGRPERGLSLRRSLTLRSASSTACNPIQRMRHARTVSTHTPRSRAIWLLFFPAAAARIKRPRTACCWGVPCRRTSRSNSVLSASLKLTGSGLGPRIDRGSSFHIISPSILQNNLSLNVLVRLNKSKMNRCSIKQKSDLLPLHATSMPRFFRLMRTLRYAYADANGAYIFRTFLFVPPETITVFSPVASTFVILVGVIIGLVGYFRKS